MSPWRGVKSEGNLLGALVGRLLGRAGRRLMAGMGKAMLLVTLALILPVMVATCRPDDSARDSTLAYSGPVEIGIPKAELLPGTDIRYLGKTEEGARVTIGGQEALKKPGDSLNWKGNGAEDMAVDLNLRVVLVTEDKLHVAGTAKVEIADPMPQPAAVNESAPIHYKMPVAYRVRKGAPIPGTAYIYVGETDLGARLANMEGYPYREVGDSIVWKAQLKDRIWLELNLRTAVITDNTLSVAGTADLWTAPE